MWPQPKQSASHIDNPDLVSDIQSGQRPSSQTYPYGDQQCKHGEKGVVKGISDSGSGIYESGRTDSGFLSGPNLTSEHYTDEIPSPTNFPDSDYQEHHSEGNKEDSQSYMRLDSGVVCLNEQLSGLNIKCTNDLNVKSPVSSNQDSQRNISLNVPAPVSISSTHQSQTVSSKLPDSPVLIQEPWQFFTQDEDGDTQLHIAINRGFIEVAYTLIRFAPHPCFLDIQNDQLLAPLHMAVLTHQHRIVRRLVVAGASVDIQDKAGNTPLHLACDAGDENCVQALLEPVSDNEMKSAALPNTPIIHHAPDLEQRNYDGKMCIHLAALSNKVQVLQLLVWAGADLNAREGKCGRTALHYAIEYGSTMVAKYLLEQIPDGLLNVETPMYSGLTAYQLAAALKSDIAARLREYGAKVMEVQEDSSDSDSDYSDDEIYWKASSLRFNGQPIDIGA